MAKKNICPFKSMEKRYDGFVDSLEQTLQKIDSFLIISFLLTVP